MARLVVIDDESSICWGLQQMGESLQHQVSVFSSMERALESDLESVDLLIVDVRLPGISGLEGIPLLEKKWGSVPVILITAYGDLQTALAAVESSVFEYLIKPFDLAQVEQTLRRALASREDNAVPTTSHASTTGGGALLGRSPVMQEVFKQLALAAGADTAVLLCGESGSGKELVARAIHDHSRRSKGPFVAVNLAALSESLAESELFGHEKGAFTGADHSHRGLLEQSDGGTLFLDEVAEIPLALQVKLLRVLELKEFQPVGSTRTIAADFRIIAASHRNLESLVQAKQFRHDLYFRLSSFSITLPPLRERREDIALLARHFVSVAYANQRPGAVVPELSHAAVERLESLDWQGNVRELRNVMERALILSRGQTIYPEHIIGLAHTQPLAGGLGADALDSSFEENLAKLISAWTTQRYAAQNNPEELHQALVEVIERPLFESVLKRCKNNYSLAARQLGIHRTTLKKKVEAYGLA